MKAVVISYSLTGNCSYVSGIISEETGCAVVSLDTVTPYPVKGLTKFFQGGKAALQRQMPELKPYALPEDADIVIFGMPVWASHITPPILTFISENRSWLETKKIAAFVCQAGSGGEKVLDLLEKELKKPLIASLVLNDPKNRKDEAKDAAIRAFARKCVQE